MAKQLPSQLAHFTELMLAVDADMMFEPTETDHALSNFFRTRQEMQQRVFHIADVVFALAGLFEARDRLEADRTREAAFRCFHLVVSRNDTMAAWELHKTRNLCTYLYCTNAGGGERNEAGLVLLRTDPRYRKVTPGAELVLWHHLRVLARECLSAGCVAVRRRLWSPCASCGRVPHLDPQNRTPLRFCEHRCRTAYCGTECQTTHWNAPGESGHVGFCLESRRQRQRRRRRRPAPSEAGGGGGGQVRGP